VKIVDLTVPLYDGLQSFPGYPKITVIDFVTHSFSAPRIFTERLWRSLKYEEIYIRDYQCVSEGRRGIDYYFNFYNHERPHQSLNYMTPAEVYFQRSGEGGKRTMPTSLSSKTSNFRPQSVT